MLSTIQTVLFQTAAHSHCAAHVCAPCVQGTLTPSGTIPGVDVIMPLLFQVWDESRSLYSDTNIAVRLL